MAVATRRQYVYSGLSMALVSAVRHAVSWPSCAIRRLAITWLVSG
jgi:hypothetical protein